MHKKTQKSGENEKELCFKMKPAVCAVIILFCAVAFGGVAGYFLWNGRVIIGAIVALFTLMGVVGLVLEQRNASLLITAEGVFQCDFLKREDRILWEKCSSILKDVRQTVTYISITQNESDITPGKQIKKKAIMIPWSRFSGKQKGEFLAILGASKMPENMKEQFFREYFQMKSYPQEQSNIKQKIRLLISAVIYLINACVFTYGIIFFEKKILYMVTAVLCGAMAIRNMIRFVRE